MGNILSYFTYLFVNYLLSCLVFVKYTLVSYNIIMSPLSKVALIAKAG
jgi:hypothetical protein